MKVHKYASYEAYVAAQNAANLRKLENVWVMRETIEEIWRRVHYPVGRILCHGTRNGAEQQLFRSFYPKAIIQGTEIAETAMRFRATVQHDFHEPREEWLGRFDILYSNSWDHSYDPRRALETWYHQLGAGRWLFLEHAPQPQINYAQESDPLEIDPEEIVTMLHAVGFEYQGEFDTRGCGKYPSMVYMAARPA